MKLIAQGAEAKIYKGKESVTKERISKSYRLKEIDIPLRKRRTRSEAKLISMASRLGLPVPRVIDIDDKAMKLEIEFIGGEKVRDWLANNNLQKSKSLLKKIGSQVKKMHQGNVTHGDLTTSNMIFRDGEVFFIDFGLGKVTDRREDKAVDIHLIKECLKSKHHEHWISLWKSFKEGYSDKDVLHQLELVEARARYKKIS